MKRTGELLKKVREEKGLSLHEIGLSLKINPKILRQIEDGEQNNLPAKTFLRGFVQSYANYLKLDSDEVLKIFSEEMGSTKPKSIPATPSLENKIPLTISDSKADLPTEGNKATASSSGGSSKTEFEFKNFGIGFLVILLLLSLIGVRKIVEKYQKESEIPQNPTTEAATTTTLQDSKNNPLNPDINNPANPTGLVTPTPQPTTSMPTVSTATSSSVTTSNLNNTMPPSPTPTPTSIAAKPQGPTALATPHPTMTPVVSASTLPAPQKTTTTSVATSKPVAQSTAIVSVATPTPTPTAAAKPKNVEVVIEAFDDVNIEITMPNGKSEVIKLSASQTQTIKSLSGVKLNFSNGGAVNLTVNGKDLGVPGDLGKPKKVSF